MKVRTLFTRGSLPLGVAFAIMLCGALSLTTGCAGVSSSPAGNPTFQMSKAVPLSTLRNVDNEVELIYKTPSGKLPRMLYFGNVMRQTADGGRSPRQAFVAVRNEGTWKALVLTSPHLVNPYWEFVAVGPKPQEAWGVINSGWTPLAVDLAVAHTLDGGATWSLCPVRKPVYAAEYNDFCMGGDGRGRLTMTVSTALEGKKTGYYHFVTHDGGRSWSGARFESDGLTVADDVEPTEQPTTLHMAAK